MSRDTCDHCSRPLSECYCDAIVSIDNPTKVIILQHPKESDHPYNTGRMAHRCLRNSELHVGVRFSDEFLATLLTRSSLLLFPELEWLAESEPQDSVPQQIIVLDATWRKAKKMLHLNPALQRLPRLALSNVPNSQYTVRSSQLVDGLATIEAIQIAMSDMDSALDYTDLMKPFERMVSLAKRYTPRQD